MRQSVVRLAANCQVHGSAAEGILQDFIEIPTRITKNKATRLLSTRKKSIKIEHLIWYLQCLVCVYVCIILMIMIQQ